MHSGKTEWRSCKKMLRNGDFISVQKIKKDIRGLPEQEYGIRYRKAGNNPRYRAGIS